MEREREMHARACAQRERQTDREIDRVSNLVFWSFTPCQPEVLYQGDVIDGQRKRGGSCNQCIDRQRKRGGSCNHPERWWCRLNTDKGKQS